ncbi:hypothetical protein NPIL_226191 [Nephila pilipes]|uniref:Uncharacterized protein n=1 Tax=Nephila pilipes TaxID=299642 RepID=A0A8X6QM24_NEPPI|nr:hypothetical protein NPIL_226191 [Nephila pilipes]
MDKNLSTKQPQHERCHSILDDDGQVTPRHKGAENLMGCRYQRTKNSMALEENNLLTASSSTLDRESETRLTRNFPTKQYF